MTLLNRTVYAPSSRQRRCVQEGSSAHQCVEPRQYSEAGAVRTAPYITGAPARTILPTTFNFPTTIPLLPPLLPNLRSLVSISHCLPREHADDNRYASVQSLPPLLTTNHPLSVNTPTPRPIPQT